MNSVIEEVRHTLCSASGSSHLLLSKSIVRKLLDVAEEGQRIDCDFTIVRDTQSSKDTLWSCTACGSEIKRLRTLGKPHFCADCGGKASPTLVEDM